MGTGIIFFKKPSDTEKCNNTTTEDIDSQYFEKVVEEIESGHKDKGLEAKALVLSEGDTTKADVLYLKLRAEFFQKEFIDTQVKLAKIHNIQIEEANKKKRDESHKENMIDLKTHLVFIMIYFVSLIASYQFMEYMDYFIIYENFTLLFMIVVPTVVSAIGAYKYRNYATMKNLLKIN